MPVCAAQGLQAALALPDSEDPEVRLLWLMGGLKFTGPNSKLRVNRNRLSFCRTAPNLLPLGSRWKSRAQDLAQVRYGIDCHPYSYRRSTHESLHLMNACPAAITKQSMDFLT